MQALGGFLSANHAKVFASMALFRCGANPMLVASVFDALDNAPTFFPLMVYPPPQALMLVMHLSIRLTKYQLMLLSPEMRPPRFQ